MILIQNNTQFTCTFTYERCILNKQSLKGYYIFTMIIQILGYES